MFRDRFRHQMLRIGALSHRGHSLANKAINQPIMDINNRSKNLEIMNMSSFNLLTNEIWILLDESEAGKRNKAIKSIFKIILLHILL